MGFLFILGHKPVMPRTMKLIMLHSINNNHPTLTALDLHAEHTYAIACTSSTALSIYSELFKDTYEYAVHCAEVHAATVISISWVGHP